MSKSFRKDLTGQKFGRLTVLGFVPTDKGKAKWKCQCDCGNISIVYGTSLMSGNTKSCGCLCNEQRKLNGKRTGAQNGKCNIIHNKSHQKIHNEWLGIKKRCFNKNYSQYNLYGGRGVTVCNEWKDNFQAFYDWAMANGYRDDLSIDRIDNNGNYEPLNCRWVDAKTQIRNRRITIMVEYNGKMISLGEAAEKSGLPYKRLWERYKRGDRGRILFRPLGTRK